MIYPKVFYLLILTLIYYCAPGVIELPALAKHKILKREGSDQEQYLGVLFLGIVVRGETTHYELVTTESFRAIGNLALEYPSLSIHK